jgi:hypothetical protein
MIAPNHYIVFGNNRFDLVVSQLVDYYHECRLYQGLGNVLLPLPRSEPPITADSADELAPAPLSLADLKCESRLGGLLKHFYREAA